MQTAVTLLTVGFCYRLSALSTVIACSYTEPHPLQELFPLSHSTDTGQPDFEASCHGGGGAVRLGCRLAPPGTGAT